MALLFALWQAGVLLYAKNGAVAEGAKIFYNKFYWKGVIYGYRRTETKSVNENLS